MSDKPYLKIIVHELGDVPIVYYKGENIPYKQHILFRWTTMDEVNLSGTTFDIQYFNGEVRRRIVDDHGKDTFD